MSASKQTLDKLVFLLVKEDHITQEMVDAQFEGMTNTFIQQDGPNCSQGKMVHMWKGNPSAVFLDPGPGVWKHRNNTARTFKKIKQCWLAVDWETTIIPHERIQQILDSHRGFQKTQYEAFLRAYPWSPSNAGSGEGENPWL